MNRRDFLQKGGKLIPAIACGVATKMALGQPEVQVPKKNVVSEPFLETHFLEVSTMADYETNHARYIKVIWQPDEFTATIPEWYYIIPRGREDLLPD